MLLSCQGNELTVTGTDLDLTIEARHEVIGIADGSAVVPARLMVEVVRSLEPGAVTVVGSEESVEVSAARSHFDLRSFPVVEFPANPARGVDGTVVPAHALAEGLRQVVPAASSDDGRPLLTGVLVTSHEDALRLVATDSYRLALRDVGGTQAVTKGEDLVVPARALGELQRLAGAPGAQDEMVDVARGSNDISFSLGAVRLTTRLLEGSYPDYSQLIPPSYPNSLHVGKESMTAALRRVRLLVRESTTPVRLAMRPGGVDLSVVSQEIGEARETVDGDFAGEELTIAFNPSFLLEGIEAVLSDEVLIETADPSKPATVRAAERDDYRYLLMPVRVS